MSKGKCQGTFVRECIQGICRGNPAMCRGGNVREYVQGNVQGNMSGNMFRGKCPGNMSMGMFRGIWPGEFVRGISMSRGNGRGTFPGGIFRGVCPGTCPGGNVRFRARLSEAAALPRLIDTPLTRIITYENGLPGECILYIYIYTHGRTTYPAARPHASCMTLISRRRVA